MTETERIIKTRESVRLQCARLCEAMVEMHDHPERPLCSEHDDRFDETCVECTEVDNTLKQLAREIRR